MTKITEQLEALSQEQIKFIHEVFSEGAARSRKEIEGVKTMASFTNAIKDLADAYFPEGETQVLNTNVNPQEFEEKAETIKEQTAKYIADLEKANKQYTDIVDKLTPLIELLNND